jgi:hypothetical protein
MNKTIKENVRGAIADMKVKISRDTKHVYRNNETGEMLQGVSTVSSIIPKDWLAAWGAKECVKFLGYSDYENDFSIAEQTLAKIKEITDPKKFVELLKEAKGAASRKSKQAMVDGTSGHKWIEEHIESLLSGTALSPIPVNTTLERPLTQFLEWEAKEVDYWIASEALVTRLDKSYAGQLDAIYMSKIDNKLTLCDFKFASFVSDEYALQTAGYAYCFEPYGIKIDKRIILRLPKTLETEMWNEKEFKYYKVPNNIEAYEIKTPYQGDVNAFCAALIVKSWINFVTKK